jgi:hypothetical protein
LLAPLANSKKSSAAFNSRPNVVDGSVMSAPSLGTFSTGARPKRRGGYVSSFFYLGCVPKATVGLKTKCDAFSLDLRAKRCVCRGRRICKTESVNRSLPTFEPVSVLRREFRREKVWRGERLGGRFWRRWPIRLDRDRAISHLLRQRRG